MSQLFLTSSRRAQRRYCFRKGIFNGDETENFLYEIYTLGTYYCGFCLTRYNESLVEMPLLGLEQWYVHRLKRDEKTF